MCLCREGGLTSLNSGEFGQCSFNPEPAATATVTAPAPSPLNDGVAIGTLKRQMSKSTRKIRAVIMGLAVLAGVGMSCCLPHGLVIVALSGVPAAEGAAPANQTPGGGEGAEQPSPHTEPGLVLPTDPSGARKLKTAEDYIGQESWAEATGVLQSLLDAPDAFLSIPVVNKDGSQTIRRTTLQTEANRLLGVMPPFGRTFYEWNQGGQARAALALAKKQNDPHLLAEVSRRYLHTTAGAEATRLLAVHHFDRGRQALAAICFERLLSLPDGERLSPLALFTAAAAFHRAGDQARADQAWRRLATRAPKGLQFGGEFVNLDVLRTRLAGDGLPAKESKAGAEWPLFRGDMTRSEWCPGDYPVAEFQWKHATAEESATCMWLEKAVQRQESRREPALPGFFPLAVDGKIVYRSHRGIHAVDAGTGRLLWESEFAGGLDVLAQDLSYFPYVEAWVNAHLQHNPHLLLGTAVVGTLSSDGERVYAVDDLAIPPYQNLYQSRGRPVTALEHAFAPGLTEAVQHSRLIALDLKSGRLVWEVGCRIGQKEKSLYPCYFLGPPLPIAGRLYGAVEKDQELHLLCLDAVRGQLLWTLPLGLAPTRLLSDPGRRVQAAQIAYAEGVLVCLTNAGMVVGIDPIGRCFLWAYSYGEPLAAAHADVPRVWWGGRGRGAPAPLAPSMPRPAWTAPAPIICDHKVIVAAPDGASVHCLKLGDGELLWKVKQREGDLYVAGVNRAKLLVVGKEACRALAITDGRPLWETTTGLPSGLGATDDGAYYLPVKTGKQPGICAIDVETGHARMEVLPLGHGPSGNLVFYRDAVISQTATAISVHRQRSSSLRPSVTDD
jgi:outer membrane protein assembly factor BamB